MENKALKAIIVWSLAIFSFASHAENKETERLASITTDYAKCADVALGSFESDEEAQKVTKAFYSEMIENIRTMIELESKSGSERVNVSMDIMGKEILVGYMLKSFTEVDSGYQKLKKELKEKYDWDWKRVHKELWSKHGCNAIYSSIKN